MSKFVDSFTKEAVHSQYMIIGQVPQYSQKNTKEHADVCQ